VITTYRIKRLAFAGFSVLASALFTVIGIPILFLLAPVFRLRIGDLREDRIGHLAAEPEIYCRLRAIDGMSSSKRVIFFAWDPANRQLLEMWKRRLNIIEHWWLKRLSQAVMPAIRRTRFFEPLPLPINWSIAPGGERCHEAFARGTATLAFTPEEEERGQRELRRMGVPQGGWFVAFHARDPAYNNVRWGQGATKYPWTYRDIPLETYFDAMRFVAERGGYAIRMGQIVSEPLPDLGPRIIDYASRYRSDFMDIYLIARSKFFIASNSGLLCIAQIFDVPFGACNMFPYFAITSGKRAIYTTMLLRERRSGEVLSFPEINARGLLRRPSDPSKFKTSWSPPFWDESGFDVLYNEPEDIRDVCLDLLDGIEGRSPPPNAQRLVRTYTNFFDGADSGPYAPKLSPRFALRYAHLIDPDNQARSGQALVRSNMY
jgi:putative glycosyltransferase (TIGR04372 family)